MKKSLFVLASDKNAASKLENFINEALLHNGEVSKIIPVNTGKTVLFQVFATLNNDTVLEKYVQKRVYVDTLSECVDETSGSLDSFYERVAGEEAACTVFSKVYNEVLEDGTVVLYAFADVYPVEDDTHDESEETDSSKEDSNESSWLS